MELLKPAEVVLESYRHEQLGLFSQALDGYRRALEAAPDHLAAAIRYCRLRRDLRTEPASNLKILWQIDPRENYWETDWVRYLLSGLNCTEIIDGRYEQFHDGCIVLDNRIDPQKTGYYFEMMKRGHRFGLFHLSDEQFYDDCSAYSFANFVLRNYWARAFADDKRVLVVPLGMMNGFRIETQKPARERNHVWAFAGNAKKSTRAQMLAAMSTISGGFYHGTYGTEPPAHPIGDASDLKAPLAVADYARLMSEAIFAPCPAGWENLDSFRLCEAFEAGCIPIVEKRPTYDYFRYLMGAHPALAIESWSETPALIQALMDNPEALEEKRVLCANWWRTFKTSIVARVRNHVLDRFSPAAV
jgi:hypothetical protein